MTIALLLSAPVWAKDTIYYKRVRKENFNAAEYERRSYSLGLLRLALEASKAEYGDYLLLPKKVPSRGKRLHWALANKAGLDVMWATPMAQFRQQTKTIPIDLLRGRGGIMVLITKKHRLSEFSELTTLGKLAPYKLGIGYKSNKKHQFEGLGLTLLFSKSRKSALINLNKGYYDFVPAELSGTESILRQNPNLAVLPHRVFLRDKTSNFHVHKDNIKLYNRIKKGLEILEETGKFEQYFINHPMMQAYFTYDADNALVLHDFSQNTKF
ncbi:MAG: hypothetical protein ACPGR2_03490 [Psychrobium sp.]